MENRLGKLQKLILIYIGINTKEHAYIKRRTLTTELSKLLDCEKTKKFCTSVSQSVNLLSKRELITKRGSYIGLTINGKIIAKDVISYIKSEYDNKIDWRIIVKYYRRKEKKYNIYIKGFVEEINKPYSNALLSDVKEVFKKCKDGDIVSIHVLYRREHKKEIDVKTEFVNKKIIKKQIKKVKSGKTKWNIFVNGLPPESATPDSFKIYTALLNMFPEVPQKVEERKQELFKHYNMVREHHPNYPPLTDVEWKAYPESWKKIDDECNKLMKIQKNKEAFSNYLFELSREKYPDVSEDIIHFAISKYKNSVE